MAIFEKRVVKQLGGVVGAATNILATSYTPTISGRLRIYFAISAAGVVSIDFGGTVVALNNGAALTGGGVFDVPADPAVAVNVQHSVGGTVTYLYMDEVRDA